MSNMAGRTVEPAGIREYSFGDYRIDLASYQLWQRGLAITLTPKVFDTLVVLIQHRDRAVTKEELLKSVWPDASVTEDSLTQSISILRKTLGDDTTHPRFITTIARRGYRFIAPVEEVPAERLAAAELPVQVANLSSIWTVLYTRPSRYNWMLQYYLRAKGLALSWIGTGRLIFSLNYTDADFAHLRSFYSEGEVVELMAAIGLFNYFNRFNDLLEMEPTQPASAQELAEAGVEVPVAQ